MNSPIVSEDRETFAPWHTKARIGRKHFTNSPILELKHCTGEVFRTISKFSLHRFTYSSDKDNLSNEVTHQIYSMDSNRDDNSTACPLSIIIPVPFWKKGTEVLHCINASCVNLTQPTSLNKAMSTSVTWLVSLVLCNHKCHLGLICRLNHSIAILQSSCHWLFNQNMLTCLCCSNRQGCMKVVRGTNIHSIYIGLRKHLERIRVNGLNSCLRCSFSCLLFVNIANRDELHSLSKLSIGP